MYKGSSKGISSTVGVNRMCDFTRDLSALFTLNHEGSIFTQSHHDIFTNRADGLECSVKVVCTGKDLNLFFIAKE